MDGTMQFVILQTGRWVPIKRGEPGYSAGDFRCTNCGSPNRCYCLTEYCSRCGAKMERRRDDGKDE